MPTRRLFDGATIEIGQIPIEGQTVTGNIIWLKVSGTWKQATPFIKVAGTWKQATPSIKISGVWKN